MIEKGGLGRAIKEIRVARGMSQGQLAKATNLTSNYISMIENGHRDSPIDTINTFASAFGVPTSFIAFLAESSSKDTDSDKLLSSLKRLIKAFIAAESFRDQTE